MAEHLALAEACAEAASAPDSEHVVQVLSLGYRRFLTEALEPLLAVQKRQVLRGGEGKNKSKGSWRGESENDPPR
jgi:hypothetical protein